MQEQFFRKRRQIKDLCASIRLTVAVYEDKENKIYFDYDTVIILLKKARRIVIDSACEDTSPAVETDSANRQIKNYGSKQAKDIVGEVATLTPTEMYLMLNGLRKNSFSHFSRNTPH